MDICLRILTFRVSVEKSGVILLGLSSYVTWPFSPIPFIISFSPLFSFFYFYIIYVFSYGYFWILDIFHFKYSSFFQFPLETPIPSPHPYFYEGAPPPTHALTPPPPGIPLHWGIKSS